MLHDYIEQFLSYCKNADYAAKSIEALTGRLKEFSRFIRTLGVEHIAEVTYQHLLTFVSRFQDPSLEVKKSRIWTLHQFYHFLVLNNIVENNPASYIPYPKFDRKVPHYLTIDEFNDLLQHFAQSANTFNGLRDLLIIMLLGCLGLRLLAVIKLNIEDIDVNNAVVWIQEKGRIKRRLPLPQVMCNAFSSYLILHDREQEALFLTKRKKRISDRTVQDLLKEAQE